MSNKRGAPKQAAEPGAASLALAVHYAAPEPRLPRWRLRRWAGYALQTAAADGLTDFARVELSLRLVGLAEGRRLNRDFRGRDYATNVLTFEYGVDPEGAARGDVVICAPILAREAREQRKPFLHHAAHLTIHGVLHALGYDHLNKHDAQRMEGLEIQALARIGIADPYITA
ncbi:rRNA maturation RNase YbeY [Bordetella sp. FB-8]|uniref:rRNA maturation RNase YbeY n=1 Tax=Bordetella sp. FB-8 TaxID=1159870 RepID=UPI00035D911B|nr:rRNA maturation RNase YbeY [Bordetella sp. FB-8]